MLTTIIYRSHICDNVSFKSIEAMVARANERNGQADVTGILLFNGTHFFRSVWNCLIYGNMIVRKYYRQ